jgi:hypothetical protein
MAFINPNQFRQINPLNNLPTAESQVIGGVERKVLSYLFPDGNGGARKGVPAPNQQFNINKFIQNLGQHNETARTDKFDVQFNCPPGLGAVKDLSVDLQGLNLQCEISELPGRDIQMVDYRLHGFQQRIPHMNQYNGANFTFIVTGDMHEKRFFDAWMDFMVPAQTGLVQYAMNDNMLNNYEADIICNQYDGKGDLAYSIRLVDALPVNMTALNQSWDNDGIHKLSMSFLFTKWLPVKIQDPSHPVTPSDFNGIGPSGSIGPPSILNSLTNTFKNTFNQRTAGLAVAGVGAGAVGSLSSKLKLF